MIRQTNHRTATRVLAVAAASTVAVGVTALSGTASAAPGASPLGWAKAQQVAELTASDGAASDDFGYAVAMSANGKVAVVGADGHNLDTGVAYVFTKSTSGWQQAAELSASDGADWTQFGESVAVSRNGSTIVVGSSGHNNSTGAAYVFSGSDGSWTQTAELTASDGVDYTYFGHSVAVSADGATVLVGAYDQGTGGTAYLFGDQSGSWLQTAELTASDAASGDSFGLAVALSGNGSTAAIGALHHASTGAVYVYGDTDGSWTQTDELTPADGSGSDFFGGRVTVSRTGSVVVVGAYGHNGDTGAAYVYTGSAGSLTQAAELTAADGTYDDYYGTSVAVNRSGSVIAVGAESHNGAAGAEYLYTGKGSWAQKNELTSSDDAAGDYFGLSAGLSARGSTLVVGAEGHEGYTGSAYLFTR